jgi:hypothetical protein
VIESINPNGINFALCPVFEKWYTVWVEVKASDPDEDLLTYHYSVSGGEILGEGARVRWDLRKAGLGRQKVIVEVLDQRGGKTSSASEIEVIKHTDCDPGCPALRVTCSSNVTEGEIATFEAKVGEPDQALKYLWSHSNGQRIPGQQGAELKIKAVGSPGDVITATVRVLGIDPACSYQASCETRIEKQIR